MTSRMHRTSSSGSQGEAGDERPLTMRAERPRSLNPFACLLKMAGSANARPRNLSSRSSSSGRAPHIHLAIQIFQHNTQ